MTDIPKSNGPLGTGKNPWKNLSMKAIQALINKRNGGIGTTTIRAILKPECLTERLKYMQKHGTIEKKNGRWFPKSVPDGKRPQEGSNGRK